MDTEKQGEETAQAAEIYLPSEDSDKVLGLDALKSLHVFVIQRKSTVDYFSSTISYEILDTRKNLLFKASKPKQFFSKNKLCKVSVKNLKNVKVFSVIVEPSGNYDSIGGSEASVYIYPMKSRIAHVEKYGGTVGPPCYEIFNADRKTAFTIDHTTKKGNSPSALEYDVSTKRGPVANIMLKTGLNSVLSTDSRMPNLEKATLLGLILAMDLLKTGTRVNNEPASNQYFYNRILLGIELLVLELAMYLFMWKN